MSLTISSSLVCSSSLLFSSWSFFSSSSSLRLLLQVVVRYKYNHFYFLSLLLEWVTFSFLTVEEEEGEVVEDVAKVTGETFSFIFVLLLFIVGFTMWFVRLVVTVVSSRDSDTRLLPLREVVVVIFACTPSGWTLLVDEDVPAAAAIGMASRPGMGESMAGTPRCKLSSTRWPMSL